MRNILLLLFCVIVYYFYREKLFLIDKTGTYWMKMFEIFGFKKGLCENREKHKTHLVFVEKN